jgi:hypothetical protein
MQSEDWVKNATYSPIVGIAQNEPNFLVAGAEGRLDRVGLGDPIFCRIKAELINGALFEIRRILPELLRLKRYERRAAARRDRAIRTLTQSEDEGQNATCSSIIAIAQNEPNFLVAAQTCGSAGNRPVARDADRAGRARRKPCRSARSALSRKARSR